jgi:hypothetical protein
MFWFLGTPDHRVFFFTPPVVVVLVELVQRYNVPAIRVGVCRESGCCNIVFVSARLRWDSYYLFRTQPWKKFSSSSSSAKVCSLIIGCMGRGLLYPVRPILIFPFPWSLPYYWDLWQINNTLSGRSLWKGPNCLWPDGRLCDGAFWWPRRITVILFTPFCGSLHFLRKWALVASFPSSGLYETNQTEARLILGHRRVMLRIEGEWVSMTLTHLQFLQELVACRSLFHDGRWLLSVLDVVQTKWVHFSTWCDFVIFDSLD